MLLIRYVTIMLGTIKKTIKITVNGKNFNNEKYKMKNKQIIACFIKTLIQYSYLAA